MKFVFLASCYFLGLIVHSLTEVHKNMRSFDGKGNIIGIPGKLGNLAELGVNNMQELERPLVDSLHEDDHEDFDLADILSLSEATIEKDADKYSNLEKMEFVHSHNIYRSNLTKPLPQGSNVQYVQWNETLSWAAGDFLKRCIWEHGWGKNDNMTGFQGQNLYTGPARSPSRPMFLWYDEYKWYDFVNLTCKEPYPKYMCGHFIQMLWYDSQHIGCARISSCFPKEPGRLLVNCHYIRKGYIVSPGFQIYKYGLPCTRCPREQGNMCYRDLCIKKSTCLTHKLDCECKLACKNCVKPDPRTCRCGPCKSGWDWEDCSYPCLDAFDVKNKMLGACNSAPIFKSDPSSCEIEIYKQQCRKRCGACHAVNMTNKENLCCFGKMCPAYHVLDENCECQMDCPSPLCLFPSSFTTKPPAVVLRDKAKINMGAYVPIFTRRRTTKGISFYNSTATSVRAHLIYVVFSAVLLYTIY